MSTALRVVYQLSNSTPQWPHGYMIKSAYGIVVEIFTRRRQELSIKGFTITPRTTRKDVLLNLLVSPMSFMLSKRKSKFGTMVCTFYWFLGTYISILRL